MLLVLTFPLRSRDSAVMDLRALHQHTLSLPLTPCMFCAAAAAARIRADRGYKHMDIVDRQPPAPEEAAAFHASLARFYVEHLHADEEARYILGGGGVWRSTAVAVMKGLGSSERSTSSLHPRLPLTDLLCPALPAPPPSPPPASEDDNAHMHQLIFPVQVTLMCETRRIGGSVLPWRRGTS